MRVFLLLLLFLTSCNIESKINVKVVIAEEHYWQVITQRPMWYSLEYFDGKSVKRKSISSEQASTTVQVYLGKSAIFVSHPIGTLTPIGGATISEDRVYLHSKDAEKAQILIEAAKYNPSLVASIDYDQFFKKLDGEYDKDEALIALLNGELDRFKTKKEKEYTITLTELPKGTFVSEYDHIPIFNIKANDDKVRLNLKKGIYKFYNLDSNINLLLTINDDGSFEIRTYNKEVW